VNSTAEQQFDAICKNPAQIGDPAQVEVALWVCMSIWASNNLSPGKNHTHTAIGVVRKSVSELEDRSGLWFHDLKTHPRDYKPVVAHMTKAFDLLRSFADGSSTERRAQRFADFVAEQNIETAHRMKQIFFADLCPECWGKRPDIIAASKGVNCRCWPRPVP
jgi:hypothetical protein